jgi:hypothetical protein
VAAARAANTFAPTARTGPSGAPGAAPGVSTPSPATPAAISQYLVDLAQAGAKVRTMSRRLSALRFAFRIQGHGRPHEAARVTRVWEGIRRTHGAPADQAAPLMPPELLDVLAACPATQDLAHPRAAA